MAQIFTILISTILLSTATARPTPLIEGAFPESVRHHNASRVIEGWPAEAGQFPHQVSLRLVGRFTGYLTECGGSLISPRWVLSAAHCLVDKSAVFVKLGGLNTTKPDIIIEAFNFYIHKNYNSRNLNNDIGLVSLMRNVETTDHIRPIRLPRLSEASKTWENSISTASGWGQTSDYGLPSEVLYFVNLTIISNSVCEKIYEGGWIINSTLCAEGSQNESQGMCFGDSGGPLIAYEDDGLPTLVGIISFVNNIKCSAPYPSGFTRPGSFLDWIAEITGIELRP